MMKILLSASKWTALPAVLCLLVLAGCNLPQTGLDGVSTIDATQVYQTVQAHLTQTLAQTPQVSPSSPSTIPVATAGQTVAALTTVEPPSARPSTPTAICDLAAAGNPIDISIADDTQMSPDQAFTKTWRLQNVGVCTWSKDYTVALFSGEAMGAPASIPLPGSVPPGQTIDISVDMVAPHAAGRYQGNWKLRSPARAWFGIGPNGSSSFWVRIVVVPAAATTEAVTQIGATVTATQAVSSPTATLATPSVTPTHTSTPATATLTPTSAHATPSGPQTPAPPTVKDSGTVSLIPNDKLDLDTHQLNNGSSEDISYEANAAGEHLLIPQSTAVLSLFGEQAPNFEDCQTASMSAAPLLVENLPQGVYLCYRTIEGLPGWAHAVNFNQSNGSLTLEVMTWSLP